MHIHYFQHEAFEGLGCIQNWIDANQYTVSSTHFYKQESLPDIDSFDLLIIMGGAMNIYDHEKHPWLVAEKLFIKQAIEKGKRVLGICLGAQLIADVLGAKVKRNRYKEIGWYPIQFSERAHKETFLARLPKKMYVFHWHGDTFEIPQDAVTLASSQGCENQGFLYQNKVMGLQFHLEVTTQSFKEMTAEMDDELKEQSPFIQNFNSMKAGAVNIPTCNAFMFSVLTQLSA
ncbi:GMP synthase (glutamine-hydrolysing) [Pustulibacterium marinum]|uniref:GMP synthase (Glutamine-hydrolysing) n=1 Tax=Pustulibacterium marinum TaxID=1224947 RepID=A0A1I7G9T1_9FLAO|nr:type 1 glutamine amidotransferase [Pustulibacterium marinum]SFU45213.1 GMP synthase (glutamine-hydrolysing) [Pustulibacterium marinum]